LAVSTSRKFLIKLARRKEIKEDSKATARKFLVLETRVEYLRLIRAQIARIPKLAKAAGG